MGPSHWRRTSPRLTKANHPRPPLSLPAPKHHQDGSLGLTTSSLNMTSSSSTGGMGNAGSMVWSAKLLSFRSRYVISGWSIFVSLPIKREKYYSYLRRAVKYYTKFKNNAYNIVSIQEILLLILCPSLVLYTCYYKQKCLLQWRPKTTPPEKCQQKWLKSQMN